MLGRQKQCSSNAVCLCSCNHDAKLVLATKRNYALLPGTCKKNNTHLQVASSGAIMWQHTSIPVHNAHVTQHMWPALCSLGGGHNGSSSSSSSGGRKGSAVGVLSALLHFFLHYTIPPVNAHTTKHGGDLGMDAHGCGQNKCRFCSVTKQQCYGMPLRFSSQPLAPCLSTSLSSHTLRTTASR
jgi:hypothetical protein